MSPRSHRRSFPAMDLQHSCTFLRRLWDAAAAAAATGVCVCECVRVRWEGGREGCWEEGRDVTSPRWCSHTSSSSPPPPPPTSGPLPSSSSPSSLPFYAATVGVCVCVCPSDDTAWVMWLWRWWWWCWVGGRRGGGTGEDMKEEVSDPEQNTAGRESCSTASNMEAETGRGSFFKRFNAAPTSVITFIFNVITDPPVQLPYRPLIDANLWFLG